MGERLCDFDTVMRLDDTAVAVRQDLSGYKKCIELLKSGGAVEGKIRSDNPNISPDGKVNGGAASALRAYDKGVDGSYSLTDKLKSGEYDLVEYKDGMLVQISFDP